MDTFCVPPHIIIATIGLVCDIVGACLVVVEVVKAFQFRGPTTIETGGPSATRGRSNPQPNPEFQKIEEKKRRWMKWGLFFLVIGFLLQIAALWVPII